MPVPTEPRLTAAQIERRRVDDVINARLRQRRIADAKAVAPVVANTNPYGNGMRNLIEILTGNSPLQKPEMGVRK